MQYFHESFSELNVESSVYNGVDGTVHVPQPREGIVHFQGDVAGGAVGLQNVCDEKRKPANDEDPCRRHQRQTGYATVSTFRCTWLCLWAKRQLTTARHVQ